MIEALGRSSLLLWLSLSLVSCIGRNFHVVDDGRLYRSAQLEPDELQEVIDEYGIRTVINLRGPNSGKDWYDHEKTVTALYGVELVDIGMSAERLPHRPDLLKLLDAFRDSQRPMLVHCRSGADRTGEASAIYAIEYMGASKDDALRQLSLRFWHLSCFQPAKRYFVEQYQGQRWAYDVYDPCEQQYEYYEREVYCNRPQDAPP